ncbi:MAG: hypothetical protein ACREII_04230 [Nitrospiraceae bacterium]
MRKALYPAILFVGFVGVLLGVNPAWTQGICPGPSPCSFGEVGFVDPTLPGRPATLLLITLCYNTFLGQPLPCGNVFHRIIGLKEPVNQICTDEAVAQGQCTNGGHQHHFDTHPVTAPPPNDKFVFENTGLQFDPQLGINTGPVFGTVVVRQQVPEVAGQILYESRVRVSPGARCAFNCFDTFHNRTLTTLHVEVPNLVPLPAEGEFHKTVRTPESVTPHPEGTFGTLRTVTLLEGLAKSYCKQFVDLEVDINSCRNARRRLSINDLSVPIGGMFDLNEQWFVNKDNGHIEHRTGTDADLNRADERGIAVNCEDDLKLRQAIRDATKILPPEDKIMLKCESGGRKHVDFD